MEQGSQNQNEDENMQTESQGMTEEELREYWDERIHKQNDKFHPTEELTQKDTDWMYGWE
jgi:hypothetical protein